MGFGGADTAHLNGGALAGTTVTSASLTTTIDGAIQSLSTARAGFGAAINRLQDASSAINATQTNLSSALSVIQDTDVASGDATSPASRCSPRPARRFSRRPTRRPSSR